MSIVIGFQFGEYALLCVDTRTIYVYGTRQTVDDDKASVRRWEHGLICGSGLTNLLERVIWRIQYEKPLETDKVRSIITQEREFLRASLATSFARDDIDSWFATTGWLLTYNSYSDGTLLVRAAIYHPSVDATSSQPNNMRYLMDDNALVIVPPELESADLQQRASEGMRPVSAFGSVREHYDYHLALCCELVRVAAERCNSVSGRMNVGIHRLDGQCEVSEIVECASPARV